VQAQVGTPVPQLNVSLGNPRNFFPFQDWGKTGE